MRNSFLLLILIATAAVRADVMNLNEFVPTHLEDASGVGKHRIIYQLAGKFEKSIPDNLTWRPDIRYGVTDKFQLETMGDVISGGSEDWSGETRVAALYQINEADNAIPVIALNPFVSFPTGKRSDGIDPAVKIILTSTLSGSREKPDSQIHLNYQIRHNASRQSGERADGLVYAAGFSRRLQDKLAVVADIIFQDDEDKESRNDYVEAGVHQEFSQGFYIGYGLGKGIGPSSPNWSAMFSFEYEI